MIRNYELTLVFSPVLDASKREEIQQKLLKGMKAVDTEDLGSLDLAYPIKKQTKGNFMRFHLEAAPEEIVKMKETFKITEGVLRYLIIKV
jgi:small subunit ribosomal protein S6